MISRKNPSKYLIDYIEGQGVSLPANFINPEYDKLENKKPNTFVNSNLNQNIVQNPQPQNPVISNSQSQNPTILNPQSQNPTILNPV